MSTCRHVDNSVIVTNQTGDFDPNRPHASIRVCTRPTCIQNAMKWVYANTVEQPHWRPNGGQWSAIPPTTEGA